MKDKRLLLGAIGLVMAAAMLAIVALLLPQPTGQKQADGAVSGHSSKNFAPLAGVSKEAATVAVKSGQQSQRIETRTASATSAALSPSAPAADPDAAIKASEQDDAKGLRYTVKDAGLSRNFVLALDEVWVADSNGKGRVIPVAASSREQLEQTLLATYASGEVARAVLYEEGADRNEFTRRVVSPLVTVQLAEGSDPAEIARLAGASSFETPDYAPGFAVLEVGPGLESLLAAERLGRQPGVLLAEAQLGRQQSKKAMPNDTLINQQWHLKFNNQAGAVVGTDLNIESVWAYPTAGAGHRGRGIRIGIVDDGVQTSHPDFVGNIDTTNDYDWNDSTPNDPSPGAGDDHGTACAGDAAARGNNGLGVAGSAPEGTIVGMRLIAAATTDQQEADAMNYLPQLIQIKSNSWGPTDTGTILGAPGPLTQAALKNATETGRSGRGTIFMWAGGNGRGAGDDSNYDGYANSIYTVAVGAFDSQSRQSSYSEPGANLVITSPSDGSSPALGKTTTDRTGSVGYASGDYASDFGGTSSATPTAAGVVALMLEANPNLGWRDVQEILMRSAKKVNPSDTDWKTAIAPSNINHNHKFGAGLIDAAAAVNLAKTWVNLSAQIKRTVSQSGLGVAIPNQNTGGITREFVVSPQDNLRVEHVTVRVNINHTARGNLKITLTSPSGTVSRLAEVHSDSGDNFANWTFMTVRNWGENASGTWRLKISDESGTGNTTGGTLTLATVEIFGTATSVNPTPSPTPTPPPTPTPTPNPTPTPTPTPTQTPSPTPTPLPSPTPPPANTTTFAAADLPKAIPDGSSTGVTSTINVSSAGTISALTASVNITHPYRGDLRVTLISPAGTSVLLHNQTGGSDDNVVLVNVPVSAFNNTAAAGQWKLLVQDLSSYDTGTLNSWSLTMTTSGTTPTPAPSPTPTPTPNPTPTPTPAPTPTPTPTPAPTPTPTAPPANSATFVATDVPKSIPDASSTGVTSTLNVPSSGRISSLTASVNITHPYRGDLRVTLISPAGTSTILHNQTGSSLDNVVLVNVPISAFNNSTATGQWRLLVQDLSRYDTGRLNSWSLIITTTP